ncbi:MAG TPA: anion permease, partial [Candidatus Prevotella intestinigallinarum]|nr:anion permease [Candidatus Prevotella intestinigallinarum]
VFEFIPIAPVTAVMAAALLMVITGCFRNVEAAYKTINWESIMLIAAMMPMSVALEKTGTSALISHSLVSSLGSMGPTVLLAGIYFTTSLLTMFISNTATAVLMAPIAMTSATEIGVSPYPFLFAVTLGASMCFASPFSTPPNALVMHAGEYTFSDYIKVGLPLQIIIGIVMVFALPLLFPM